MCSINNKGESIMPQDDYMSQSESQHDEMNSHSRGNTLSSHMNCYPMDTRHSQTVGERGPVVLQDNVLHEKLETFAHSKILERPVHVKGYGAFGYFQTINSMRKYTKLCFCRLPASRCRLQ